MITGFGPIATPDSRALVLGTAPSVQSLAAGQYYAHPRNQFWKIMSALFDDGVVRDYDERVRMLERNGVALWDVLHEVERQGSLDSAIVREPCVPNDIETFLGEHPFIHAVFFNGAEAERLFGLHFAALLVSGPSFERLPSTSPANASLSFDGKVEAWSAVRNVFGSAVVRTFWAGDWALRGPRSTLSYDVSSSTV